MRFSEGEVQEDTFLTNSPRDVTTPEIVQSRKLLTQVTRHPLVYPCVSLEIKGPLAG